MASKEEVRKRQAALLRLLEEKQEVCYDEIERELGISKRTVNSDLAALREAGNEIRVSKDEILLQKKTGVIEHSSPIVMRCFGILSIIGVLGQATKNDIRIAMDKWKHDEIEELLEESDVQRKRLDRQRKQLDEDLKRMIERRLITEENGIYQVSIDTPYDFQLKKQSLRKIYDSLLNNRDAYAYKDLLEVIKSRIEEKMIQQMNEEPQDVVPAVLMGKNAINIGSYEKILNEFFALPYASRQLHIVYRSRYQTLCEKTISVGELVYVCDRGCLYLIAFDHGNGSNLVIDLASVSSVKALEKKNDVFHAEQYNEMCKQMLYISVEDAQEVQIEFDDVFGIKNKIQSLSRQREGASVECVEDRICYRDTIRGIDDFAKLLRRYGKSCHVVGPATLARKMYTSSCKILERYGENE